MAQLKMLHSLALQLNQLDDPNRIAAAITTELKTLIDYHNCRIYLLGDDGWTLSPIVFRGELTEYEGETYEELVTHVGEGFTGHAVQIGETYYAPDALRDDVGVQIEGTSEIDESILVVPLKTADRTAGAIVLSNLGIGQFDEEDIRVVEVLASHAAVAFDNARLLQEERRAAATASALLGLSQALTGAHDVETVLDRVTAAVPAIVPSAIVATYLRDPGSGAFRLMRQRGADERRAATAAVVDAETAARLLLSTTEPFVLAASAIEQVPHHLRLTDEPRAVAVAPLHWEPDGFGALVVSPAGPDGNLPDGALTLLRGIADITSLALGSARRFHELERFHELVESLDAIFWEADPETLGFTFLSRRAELSLGGPDDDAPALTTWGAHIHPEDREPARIRLRAAIADGGDHHLEYRALGREGESIWLRDLVHVIHDASGAAVLRGLIVDITERKRAEQALRRSERKYSEAFRREREATQRLRALDEMKNTFLEAVSHDLRTPLTSILGSAVTLEQASATIAPEDATDLLRRIAANARKLERLLSDLLDLDRLQRGIISPQRRPTDLAKLVAEAVEESDLLGGRSVHVDVPETLVANLDAAKVERIVENLLANAARHTPPESRVWVTVRRDGDGILLMVDDEGDGVPLELREAVFEPFRQGPGPSEHSPGVGVGLSLVARFAELHGGAVWVEDRPGGGASFRVYLPER
ncbi:MAG TPA: ATP-binding protein [Actinomycetota bacterium]|nr:ATP-binding protein [Actinomycetota bacterium]